MHVLQSHTFKNAVKKLHKNQKESLDEAIKVILGNPLIGELKKGDLAEVRVYKFRMINNLTLVAYKYEEQNSLIKFFALAQVGTKSAKKITIL
jgi:ParE-like toxin of type II bacterial toxin-antitoxin system